MSEKVLIDRKLLADLLSQDRETRINAERSLYAHLANTTLPQPAAVEVRRYWFIGDAGLQKGQRTCKKSLADGSLAFFESEFDAKRACRRHPGTEVYPVEFVPLDQHNRIMAATAPANTVEVPICRLGALGRAYDTPAVCRAYTYKEQPLNDHAWKLGQAASSVKPGGDYIDTGLSLLQQLEEAGFGVFELRALREVKP
ncbi:hypothetical protein [Pseudomonas xionganensis]|uniref:Uncharacterized protein n=1 Tax=Pseudomonas xionganensis TaxID=2654845 RepID=A0A6I4KS49_9PSED|nr:hypothetical protein [Pseudomonas xionganensis]MVW75350.1 hypothetical protein [Pseudomonas xionganensis]